MKKSFRNICIAIFFLTGVFSLSAKSDPTEFLLVKEGRANSVIQVPVTPEPQELYAAMELQKFIKKITGTTLILPEFPPVFYKRKMNSDSFVGIIVGRWDKFPLLIPASIKEKLEKCSNEHAFYIYTHSLHNMRYLIITGKTAQGVLYGAYAFLEDYLGIRFFHAGEEGTCIPPARKTLSVKKIDDFRFPWLKERYMGVWYGSVAPWKMEDVIAWQIRRGYTGRVRVNYRNTKDMEKILRMQSYGHAPARGGHVTHLDAIPEKQYFKSHPEYFPMINGKRCCPKLYQTCLTNPEVRKLILEYALGFVHAGFGYQFGFADNTKTWCMCPECIKYGTDEKGHFSYANLAHRFVSEMSDEVLKRVPEAKLTYTMYSQYRDLPTIKDVKYDKRIPGIYCPHQRCYAHSFSEKNPCNKALVRHMKEWKKIMGTPMGIFDYYSYAYAPYNPLEYTLAEDMKIYRDMGICYFLEDCSNKNLPIPHSNWQFYYAASKLMWNADLDIEKLMEDAYDKYYGKAALPMKKYHALRRKLFETSPGHVIYPDQGKHMWCLTQKGAEEKLLQFLSKAEKLAAKDPLLTRRIRNDRKFLTRFWIKDAAKLKKIISSNKSVPAVKRSSPVKIDGILDEKAWKTAPLITGFAVMKSKGAPPERTNAKLLFDDKNWYLGIECMTENAWGPMLAKVKKHDGEVWTEDRIEVTLVPPGAGLYFHYIINSIGTLYDARIRDTAYEFGGELKTALNKNSYVIEMRIPVDKMRLSYVEKPSADGSWKLNIYRFCSNLQPPAARRGFALDGVEPHDFYYARKIVDGTKNKKK